MFHNFTCTKTIFAQSLNGSQSLGEIDRLQIFICSKIYFYDTVTHMNHYEREVVFKCLIFHRMAYWKSCKLQQLWMSSFTSTACCVWRRSAPSLKKFFGGFRVTSFEIFGCPIGSHVHIFLVTRQLGNISWSCCLVNWRLRNSFCTSTNFLNKQTWSTISNWV